MFAGKVNERAKQIESKASINGSAVTVIVGLDGYDYKWYKRTSTYSSTVGKNVHISMNGPLQMTFDELEEFADNLKDHVKMARETLES